VHSKLFAIGILFTGLVSGCAYRFGLSDRALPGGYTHVAIPIFKNKSQEVGIEPLLTNALIRRFERSQVAHVTDKESAPVILEGTVTRLDTVQGAMVARTSIGPGGIPTPGGIATLPGQSVLVNQYRLTMGIRLVLRRKSDDKVIWQGDFSNEKVYDPPQIGVPIINSADATYNQSAKIETLGLLAEQMMDEAHDRITENY
jgi:hypothetical protein